MTSYFDNELRHMVVADKRINSSHFDEIFDAVRLKLIQQQAVWGDNAFKHTRDKWLSLLTEELGKAARANNQYSLGEYQNQLVDIAALAISILQASMLENEGGN